MTIPRVRGRAGQADDGPDKGKWFYEITVWDLGGEKQLFEGFLLGPFKTESLAKTEGVKAVRLVMEGLTEELGGDPKKYIDMKLGGLSRKWETDA